MFRNLWPFPSLQNPCDNHLLNDQQGDIKHVRYAADSANENSIAEALPMLRRKCAEYPPNRIYNMDETALFYR